MLREISLKADEWFDIEGRGLVAALNLKDQGVKLSELCNYKRKKIKIDSKEYTLLHIECFQTNIGVSEPVGLVVRKVNSE
jgi:hypothetical protein